MRIIERYEIIKVILLNVFRLIKSNPNRIIINVEMEKLDISLKMMFSFLKYLCNKKIKGNINNVINTIIIVNNDNMCLYL